MDGDPETAWLTGSAEKLDFKACQELVSGLAEPVAIASGTFYDVIKLKQHEVDALARPLSRQVARRPWLHRIIRDVTDPLLFGGALLAIVYVRRKTVRLMKAGILPMPVDEIAEFEKLKQRAEVFTRSNAADAAAAAEQPTAAAPEPTPATPNVVPINQSAMVRVAAAVPAEPALAESFNQLQAGWG